MEHLEIVVTKFVSMFVAMFLSNLDHLRRILKSNFVLVISCAIFCECLFSTIAFKLYKCTCFQLEYSSAVQLIYRG